MLRPHRDDVVDIGAEGDAAFLALAFDRHLDRQEGRVLDLDADPLDRGDQDVAVRVLAQHRGEELHQRRPSDRRVVVEPGSVACDSQRDLAAIGRVPALDGRRPLAASAEPSAALRRSSGSPVAGVAVMRLVP
jgi:hypothetical protein